MTANNEDVIDLTCSFTLANHCDLRNVVIDLDTDESLLEETNSERSNDGLEHRRKPKSQNSQLSKSRATTGNEMRTIDYLCPTDNKKKKKTKKKKEKVIEKPTEKKSTKDFGGCPICFDKFGTRPLSATKCGHVFCSDCIKLAMKSAAKCPQCRTRLKGAGAIHPLFLS